MKKEMLKGALFGLIVVLLMPCLVNAETKSNIFGSGLNRTTATYIYPNQNPLVRERTCTNRYVELLGIHGYRSCDYEYFSGSDIPIPRSFTWWFDDFSQTKGKNWQADFRIYATALEFDFPNHPPNVTIDTDYGTVTCKVSYGGYNYLNVSCAGQSTKMFVITVWQPADVLPHLLEHYYVLSNDYSRITTDLDSSSIINNNNQNTSDIINNQNQNQQQTNEKLDGINDSLTDDSIDTEGANSFFDSFSDTDHGGLSGVITAPLRFVNKITATCEPINFKMWNKDISLPCGDTLFWGKSEVKPLRDVWNLLFGGGFLYMLMLKLYRTVQNLKNPDDDRIEMMDL